MSSIHNRTASGTGSLGFARSWWRWWMDTRGVFLGVVIPAICAVAGLLVSAAAFPLLLAAGIAFSLFWPMGATGRALALVVGVLAAVTTLVAAAGLAGVLLLFLILFGVGLPALLVGGWYLVFRLGRIEPHYGARWASEQDTADMQMWGEEEWNMDEDAEHPGEGVSLAEHYRNLIGVKPGLEGRREMGHLLVCGPSRSGKGLHLITNMMFWLYSAIVLDIKGELYRLTAGMRKDLDSDILVLDPAGRGNRYDPFRELSYSSEALRSAVMLVMEPEKERQPIFAQRGGNAFYAAVLGARLEDRPTLPYIRELTSEGPVTFVERLASLEDLEIRRALVDFLGFPPEQIKPDSFEGRGFLPDAWGTLIGKLAPFFTQGVLKMCGGSDFEAADLVRGRASTLYLMFREGELRYTGKVFSVVMLALMTGLIRHADLEPDEETVPMLLALDEAGRTPIPGLDDMVSTISGRGMSALIYVQDLAQLEGAYGRYEAQVIRSNCHTQVYYRPADYDTAAHVSRRAGQTSVQDMHVSGAFGEKRSYGQRARELVTPDEIMQMDQEDVIVFAGKKPPIFAHRLEWFEMFDEEKLTEAGVPEVPELPLPEMSRNGDNPPAQPERAETGSNPDWQPRRERREERKKQRQREGEEEVGGYVEPEL